MNNMKIYAPVSVRNQKIATTEEKVEFVKRNREFLITPVDGIIPEEAIDKIKESIGSLVAIKGISKNKAKLIQERIIKKDSKEKTINSLLILGLSIKVAFKVYDLYYNDSFNKIVNNIYDIECINFDIADKIFLNNLDGKKNDKRRNFIRFS